MKPSWSERNTFEKAVLVIQALCAVVMITYMIFALLSHKNISDCLYIVIALESFLEAAVQFRHNRKAAWLSIAVVVSSIVCFIQGML